MNMARAARAAWKELKPGKAVRGTSGTSVWLGKRPAARASETQWNNLQGWAGALTQYWSGAQPTVDARVLAFFSQAGFLDAHLSNARKFLKHLVVTELKTVIDRKSVV